MKQMYVYIMANRPNGTLYIGVTSNLVKRVWEHKNHVFKGFTDKYDVCRLVYFEVFQDQIGAIQREKTLKCWNRPWKKELIEKKNPKWDDLYRDIVG